MTMTIIVIIVVALLLIGIGVANTIQRREQQAAEKRHHIANHRACARDAQEMLDLGASLPFDVSVRDVLLDYMALHLAAINELDSSTPNLQDSMNYVNVQRQNNKPTDTTLQLPTQSEQLTLLRTQLHRLTEFVARLRADPRLNKVKTLQAFQYLARLRLRCDVEGHFKLAELALQHNQVNLAHQYATYARDRLMQENISDSYVQEQIAVLEQVTNAIKLALESAADPQKAVAAAAEAEAHKKEDDLLFGQKKKW